MVLNEHKQCKCISTRASLWRGRSCRVQLHLWLPDAN